ncbi:MAG: hypothetical protein ABI165_11080, partial [Bryobacteraceae bacterium]
AASYFLANGLILDNSLTVTGGAQRPGQPATNSASSAGQRNVAAVAPIDQNNFALLTTAVQTNLTSTTRDDPRATLELVNLATGSDSLIGPTAENPVFEVFGGSRQSVPPRQMVVDAQGTVYIITLSGLSVIPSAPASAATQPQIAGGAVVNSADGSATFAPGAFITINGANLASQANASQLPAPTVLGGSCVVFDNVALPLLQTSPTQISAQLPSGIRPGINVVQVRSLSLAQDSAPMIVTVAAPSQ